MSASARRFKALPRYTKKRSESPPLHRPRRFQIWMPARFGRQLVLVFFILTTVVCLLLQLLSLKGSRHRREVPPLVPRRTPTRYRGLVPILDREKYEEVEARMQYYVQRENREPDIEDWTVLQNPSSPPKVTSIPEMRSRTTAVELWPNEKADLQLCPSLSGCRFLLPTWIGEQESKAIRHVFQLGLLARNLNRTLILPPMWKSRFGTCYRNPFNYYYREEALARHGIPSVTFESFQSWTSLRFTRPTARLLEILTAPPEPRPLHILQNTAVSETVENGSKGKRNNCLNDKTPRMMFDAPAVTLQPLDSKWHIKPDGGSGIANDIVTLLKQESRDVIAITWELRYPVFPVSMDVHLDYAPRWIELAQLVAKDISPFIAVHWRMETVPAHHMRACALELVSTINSMLHLSSRTSFTGTESLPSEINEITAVYLATDYPLEGNTAGPHSGTFKNVGEAHHAAINTFKNAFAVGGELSSVKLTSLGGAVGKHNQKSLHYEDMDSGLIAILDKMIAIRANWFLSGTKECSRQSSFTEQIISSRSQALNGATDGERLRNIVDYFGPNPS